MYKILFIIAVSIFFIGCEQKPLAIVDDSRGEAIVDLQTKSWKFADYRGKWIIVNYWAGWCKPCITEIPELESFYKTHKDKDAIVLGVNFDFYTPEDTAVLAQKYGITYPVLTSENDPRIQMGVEPVMVLPTTFIINPQGEVVYKLIGEQSKKDLEKWIEE